MKGENVPFRQLLPRGDRAAVLRAPERIREPLRQNLLSINFDLDIAVCHHDHDSAMCLFDQKMVLKRAFE